jgi:hypothetical protein
MNRYSFLIVLLAFSLSSFAQDGGKKKFNLKVPTLNIGEKIGTLAGNLMTGKTAELEVASAKISYITGSYPVEINTSESKFFPKGTVEGDYITTITFFKEGGMGLLEVQGEVLCDGTPMEYVGLGSYLKKYDFPPDQAPVISVKTTTGDQASFALNDVASIEILTVNSEATLPILDLSEDIELAYFNPEGSEGTRIRVSLVTDVMGARALNHFADFPVTKTGIIKVTIPKESLANPEIAGDFNTGQFNKGQNWLILEREQITAKEDYTAQQNPGQLASSELKAVSYASMPIIIKGKQEEGIITSLRVTAKSADKTIGYDFYKPNATTGIPFSSASKFGLISFTMAAETYKQESETSESSYTMGGTRYTTSTTRTTTYQFPELPEAHWEFVMDKIYNDVVAFFKSNYNIDFVPVKDVTSTPQYSTLFPESQGINSKVVKQNYKGTSRATPRSLGEILGSVSSNNTSDNPQVNMMKAAGELDGLLSMQLTLQVGANEEGSIVLIPTLRLGISGRDETNNSKLGKYLDGYVVRTTGNAFNAETIKSSKEELLRVCSHAELIMALKSGINILGEKEVAMGYDKIWSIGE